MEPLPWQLQMFKRSIKKKIKVSVLKRHLGDLKDKKCLLITNGDNNGALNYYLKECGGTWTWADLQKINIPDMEELLEMKVHHLEENRFDLPASFFDYVVTIDVHEHLKDPEPFNKELMKVTKSGGKIIVTTPSNSEGRAIAKIRNSIGMTKEVYGHVREGYNINELEAMLYDAGMKPCASNEYSKFFTELLELMINFAYVKVLSTKMEKGMSISPTSKNQLKHVKKSFRVYSALYPILWLISKLDALLIFEKGYAVVVEAQRI